MGQPDKQVEGSEAADLLEEASFFPELSYQEKGVKLELLGNESINGTDCFKVLVTDARGKTKTDFFAVDSGLKLRTSEIEKSGEQEVTVTREYDDYKPVSNILFPHKWIIKGAMPVPLNAVVSAISVNSQVSDDLFILSK
jgi:hypothetical protein